MINKWNMLTQDVLNKMNTKNLLAHYKSVRDYIYNKLGDADCSYGQPISRETYVKNYWEDSAKRVYDNYKNWLAYKDELKEMLNNREHVE